MAGPVRRPLACAFVALAVGCGSSPASSLAGDAGSGSDAGISVVTDGGSSEDSSLVGDAAVSASRFVTSVVSFSPTECAGFGQAYMPGIVEGPPIGGGTDQGSTDVVSLGSGGSIVVSFAPNAIVDGPGPDFIVFENPFEIGGSTTNLYAEPGEVSVSDDGTTWQTFPCTPAYGSASDGTGTEPPYGSCAGWHVVLSTPDDGISPFDPTAAGGDAFNLSDLGVTHARYVRIVDHTAESCPEGGPDKPTTNGFDLDAIAILNAEQP